MKRRRFLSSMAIIVPAAFVSTELLLSSCNSDVKEEYFTEENIDLLDEIGETIIPATSTSPGAKEAGIGEFMKVYVTDCYTPEQQKIFWTGINKIKEVSKRKYSTEFSKLAISQKQEVLNTFVNASKNSKSNHKNTGTGDAIQTGKSAENKDEGNDPHFYSMIQHLTVFGYFTSKPGATKAVRYIQTPGSYKGEVPYKKGDKVWAT